MDFWSSTGDDSFQASEKLVQAVSFNKVGEVLSAIKEGANINYLRLDISPILTATMRGYNECIDILLSHKAEDLPNGFGWTAFLEACIQKTPDILTQFLSHLDNYDEEARRSIMGAKDNKGIGAMASCMEHNRMDNAKLLFSVFPESITATDNDGCNLALQAVKQRNPEFLEWFLKKGVSPYQENSYVETAFSEATDAAWEEGLRLIRDFAPNSPSAVAGALAKTRPEVQSGLSEQGQETVDDARDAPTSNPFGLGVKRKR